MAFPTTSIVDSGVGADANSPLSGWETIQALHDGNYRSGAANTGIARLSNKFKAQVNSWQLSNRTTVYGADQEAIIQIDSLPLDGDEVAVFCRMGGGLDATWSGYRWMLGQNASDFNLTLQYVLEGERFTIATVPNYATLAAGRKIGLECIGTAIKGYYYDGSSWQLVSSVTDGNVTGGGKIGLEIRNQTARVSNLQGGTVVVGGGGGGTNSARDMTLLGLG